MKNALRALLGWLNRFPLLYIGIDEATTARDRKYVFLFNVTASVFCLGMVSKVPVYLAYWPATALPFALLAVNFTLGLYSFVLTRRRRYLAAVIWGFSIALVHISLNSLIVGPQNVHYHLMIGLLGACMVMRPEWKRPQIAFVVANLVCFFLIDFWYRMGHGALAADLPERFHAEGRTGNAVVSGFGTMGFGLWVRSLFERSEAAIEAERERSERLLRNILPEKIVLRLKDDDSESVSEQFESVTVLFADLVDFTRRTERSTPAETVDLLNRVFTGMDDLAERLGLEKIKTIGDAYMVVGGLPERRGDHLAAVLEMALATRELVRERFPELSMRIGVDTGPVVAGVIGRTKFSYDLWGDCVNTASRMESHGVPGEIQVTGDVRAAAPPGYRFTPRGEVEIKGKGRMELWLLEGRDGRAEEARPEHRPARRPAAEPGRV